MTWVRNRAAVGLIAVCQFLSTPTGWAQGPPTALVEALRQRHRDLEQVRVVARWRTYRAPADDPENTARWTTLGPGVDPDYDFEYLIVRPWWRLRMVPTNNPREGPADYSWVRGELTQLGRPVGLKQNYVIVNHRNLGLLRGNVFLTPVELELFDVKESLHDLAGKAEDAAVRRDEGGLTLLEFTHPVWSFYIVRAALDGGRGWAPMMLELHTKAQNAQKPMSWLMKTKALRQVENSWIVGEALIINRNPNVLPETVVVTHFCVTDARAAPELSTRDLHIEPPTANAYVTDIPRLLDKELDETGRLVRQEHLNYAELEEQQRLWSVTAEEALRRGLEHRSRRTALVVIVIGAACLTVALGAVAWWRYRRGRMAA